jgi:hypothetical protein
MSENEKYEPMSLEDYQLDESDYDESDVDEIDYEPEDDVDSETEQEFEQEEDVQQEEQEEQDFEQEESSEKQSSEQNAYYAEQRRQNLIEQRVQEELERQRQQAPEFQMAQMLSNMYGMPVEQLYEQLQEAAIAKQAEEQGIPVEVMRQLSQYEQSQKTLQEKVNQMEFLNWKSRIDKESEQLGQQFPMLSADELHDAKLYLLDTLQNPEFPLQQAVFALHGDKITNSLKEAAKQEALAEISGRKKGGLPPQSMKTSDTVNLTEEERYVAKMMGMSEADYIKYK